MILLLDPIGSMYAIYGNIYHQYTPFMLAYIPAPWILWGWLESFSDFALGWRIAIYRNRSLSPSTTRRSSNRCLATRRPQNAVHMAMDQYLLIPFLGGWTSINPSYFDVNFRGITGFDTLPCVPADPRNPTNNSIFSANHPVAFQNFEPSSCTVDSLWWPD